MNDRKSEEGADPADDSQAHEGAEEAASHNDAGPDDDKVGYCRPPKATRFQPGKSGNPAGARKRKASRKLLLDRFEELLSEPVEGTVHGRRTRMDPIDAFLRSVMADSFKGKHQARKQVFEMIKELDARILAEASTYINPNGKVYEFNWDDAQKELFRELQEACEKSEKGNN